MPSSNSFSVEDNKKKSFRNSVQLSEPSTAILSGYDTLDSCISEPLDLGHFGSLLVDDSKKLSSPSSLPLQDRLPANRNISSRASTAWSELSRLKFSSLGIYGRDSELQKLHDIFNNIGEQEPLSNLVVVGGRSGTGKTTLVMEFGRRVRNKAKNVLFVSGRFEQHKSSPYAAFRSAFTQLCTDLLSHNLYETNIRSLVRSALGVDYNLMLDLIPNIGELVYEAGSQATDSTTTIPPREYDVVKSSIKFKFLLTRFLRAVCQPEHKVVLFLDDMQWIDTASLKLLEYILNDTELGRTLLIVGTYRDDEVDIENLLDNITATTRKVPTHLLVGNFSPATVECFLADLLNEDRQGVEELAKIVYERVHGNAFFLVQFLSTLSSSGYLTYNLGSMKWQWDETEIRLGTVVATNVLVVLMSKIADLAPEAKSILQTAACLGSTFTEDVISIVANDHQYWESDGIGHDLQEKRPISEILESLITEGLVEVIDAKGKVRVFGFVHSQIELAAYNLMEDSRCRVLELQIARILHRNRSNITYPSILFTIVDLFNNGSDMISDSHETSQLIELNFEAGNKALESSAFLASSAYFRNALSLLPENERWLKFSDLTLKLYNGLIKAEYSNGRWDRLREHVDEILTQKSLSILEKMTAYDISIAMLSVQQHNHVEAIELALDILRKLGINFRKNPGKLGVIQGLLKTKLLLRKTPLTTLLDKERMTDTNKLLALNILSTVNSSLYAANPDLHFCTVLKTLRWSLRYGIAKDTAKCLSIFAVVEMVMGDSDRGKQSCQIAIELAKKHNLMKTEYAPIAIGYGFVMPWSSSLHSCRTWMLQGYHIGMRTGDLHYGFLNVVMYCYFCYLAGKPLSQIEADMRAYARQMEEYQQTLQLEFLTITWQTILNLMGRCSDPVKLSGEVMDYKRMLATADRERNAPLRGQVECHRLELAVYFLDFGLASELIKTASTIASVNPGNPIIWRNALFEGVAAFELVRRGKRKWKDTAVHALSRVKAWVDAGNPNCVHILHLLQAEKAAMDGDGAQSRILFDKAIASAGRNGFRMDQALANERCADMCRWILEDKVWTNHYRKKAIEAYTEAEAFGKVASMTNQPMSGDSSIEIAVISYHKRNANNLEGEGSGSSVLTDSFSGSPGVINPPE